MGIKKELLDNILSILSSHIEIHKVVIFGSRAKGNFKPSSDIDICIYGNSLSEKEFGLICDELLELNTILDFDILHFEKLSKSELIKNIERDGICIYVAG